MDLELANCKPAVCLLAALRDESFNRISFVLAASYLLGEDFCFFGRKISRACSPPPPRPLKSDVFDQFPWCPTEDDALRLQHLGKVEGKGRLAGVIRSHLGVGKEQKNRLGIH